MRAPVTALTGAVVAAVGSRALGVPEQLRGPLERTNFHGRTVSLRGGVGAAIGAVAAGAAATLLDGPGSATGSRGPSRAGAAALIAAASGGAAGLIDDLDAGAHDGDAPAKGLKGHLGALARGTVTTGALKIAVIGSGAVVAGAILAEGAGARRIADGAVRAVVIASWANVHNLLDLRPGRALKAAALLSAPMLAVPGPGGDPTRQAAAGVLSVAAASLPEDLAERTMLGDTGANAVGALVGTAMASLPWAPARLAAAGAGTALVLASERVSFSRVIARTWPLALLDSLGRRAE